MDNTVFTSFREIIARESGIFLSDEKKALLTTRIGKRLRALGLNDAKEYLYLLCEDRSGSELEKLIDAISTNVTFFFREPSHFDFFDNVIDEWKKEKRKKIRVWCAASATGEEPYTIAMCAAEKLDMHMVDFKLLATDICIDVLQKASNGLYHDDKFKNVPAQLKSKYFTSTQLDGEKWHQANDNIRRLIAFKRLNLSRFPIPLKGSLDFIFCRNVMIYFTMDLRQQLVAEYYKLLKPGGYLIVGHSENLLGIDHNFKSLQNTTYQKKHR